MIEPARSFDRAAEEYERARPGYPAELLDLIPLPADATVLDLGAGTGKLTRVLATRYRAVVAVEPLDGMRAILESVVPAVESLAGRAEAIPLPDASMDGVFAAQAFHWFANERAVAEIARVLRPGGVVSLVWNEPAEPSPLPKAYIAYFEKLHESSLTAVRSAPTAAALLGSGPFGELHEAWVPHQQQQDRAAVLDFARSMSWIAHRDEDERVQILSDLDALLPAGPFTFSSHAKLSWAVRV